MSAPATLALLALLAVTCTRSGGGGALHVPSPAWPEQIVYFVMTDRFANGDRGNDDQGAGEFDPTSGDHYSGGDLQGIIDRLDYIQGLGATAVWITPPVANMWWDPLQNSGGYHGYWARDLGTVDEHLGTLDTYRALSRALHARGMYLIQDVVPNHMGNFFQYTSYDPADPGAGVLLNGAARPTSRPTQPPFDQCDPTDPAQRAAGIYHWTPAIADFSDPVQEKDWQISDLDDLDTENPAVRRALRDAYGAWIREVGVDAFRVDTAKFVPHAFWADFFHATDAASPGILGTARATGRDDFLAFGEVFESPTELDDAAERKVASYLGTPAAPELPSVLQFPLYEEVKRVFASGRPTSLMTYRLGRFMDPALFPDPTRIPTFVDNHDVQRFLALGTPAGLAQALAFLYTLPGIPVVYMGTEQGFTETRAAMFQGGFGASADRFDATSTGYQRLARLAALRRAHPVFTRGGLEVLYDSAAGAGPFAYRRTLGGETALVLMNTADERVVISNLATGLPAGTALQVLYAEPPVAAPEVGAAGALRAVLPARATLVLRATSQVTTPTAPAATIVVDTPVAGQTFTQDVTITGSVTPATTRLTMVLDGYLDRGTGVLVKADGTWSKVLPVSVFPTGRGDHSLIIAAPDVDVATASMPFVSDVVFAGDTYVAADPVGDDRGPAGAYTYPEDATFRRQMDLAGVTLEVGVTTLSVKVTMADWSTVWNPTYGFDHVAFNLFFSLPGQVGATVLPRLNATAPAGFAWSLAQATYGWGNAMYRVNPATPDDYGASAPAPTIQVNPGSRTVSFTYDRTKYGLASWSGVQVYVTTWDFDGINAIFRPLVTGAEAHPWAMGGGATACQLPGGCTDPKIMDDLPPIPIP
ncbi:MAG: DUF3459 domain-containing protein [Anaeromyxobacter sp.]|nr:DUF3459 domain-containing protein [Anaeromyxobacter sp.]